MSENECSKPYCHFRPRCATRQEPAKYLLDSRGGIWTCNHADGTSHFLEKGASFPVCEECSSYGPERRLPLPSVESSDNADVLGDNGNPLQCHYRAHSIKGDLYVCVEPACGESAYGPQTVGGISRRWYCSDPEHHTHHAHPIEKYLSTDTGVDSQKYEVVWE